MFIVKGVRPPANVPDVAYTVFQCDYYIAAPSTINGVGPPGKSYVPPQVVVELYERSTTGAPSSQVAFMEVGVGEGQYCTVYVMNDRGKTIDTIQARE